MPTDRNSTGTRHGRFVVVGVVLALTIAGLFDSPTSVFLLVGLVDAHDLHQPRARATTVRWRARPSEAAVHILVEDGPLADPTR